MNRRRPSDLGLIGSVHAGRASRQTRCRILGLCADYLYVTDSATRLTTYLRLRPTAQALGLRTRACLVTAKRPLRAADEFRGSGQSTQSTAINRLGGADDGCIGRLK